MTKLTGAALIEEHAILSADELVFLWMGADYLHVQEAKKTYPMIGWFRGYMVWWLDTPEEYLQVLDAVQIILNRVNEVQLGFDDLAGKAE